MASDGRLCIADRLDPFFHSLCTYLSLSPRPLVLGGFFVRRVANEFPSSMIASMSTFWTIRFRTWRLMERCSIIDLMGLRVLKCLSLCGKKRFVVCYSGEVDRADVLVLYIVIHLHESGARIDLNDLNVMHAAVTASLFVRSSIVGATTIDKQEVRHLSDRAGSYREKLFRLFGQL